MIHNFYILPIETNPGWGWGFSNTLLSLKSCQGLFEKIQSQPFVEKNSTIQSWCGRVPDGSWQDEFGYGEVKPVKFISAGVLTSVMKDHYNDTGDDRNLAVVAYLSALPKDSLVGLHWC